MSPVTQTYRVKSILVHRITLEEIWRVDLEAVASKVVCKKLTGAGYMNEKRTPGLDWLTRLLLSSRPKTSGR